MPIDWSHAAEMLGVAFGGAVPVLLYMAANKRSDRQDAEKRVATAKAENEARHKKTQESLDYLVLERTFLRPHYHQETEGPLHAEGIIRKLNGA